MLWKRPLTECQRRQHFCCSHFDTISVLTFINNRVWSRRIKQIIFYRIYLDVSSCFVLSPLPNRFPDIQSRGPFSSRDVPAWTLIGGFGASQRDLKTHRTPSRWTLPGCITPPPPHPRVIRLACAVRDQILRVCAIFVGNIISIPFVSDEKFVTLYSKLSDENASSTCSFNSNVPS